MRGVNISILVENDVSISIKGSLDGKILGYWLDSTFFRRKDRELFLSKLKEVLDDKKYEDTLLIIDKKEKEFKNRFKEYKSNF
ncbi:hypothetical protein BK007_01975 [Methanobacterium subterraneum]|uniref:Uncharacterized protein n=1 Tax=Methanobacterium subterraneum TaxID=59277 RepID=A0A2H4V9Y8_9EURY|nr:hypothetical protein [Methanobacterium subterraneum]AUB54906.1 hypothetical protein BK007_01975 [Methanobacterium subterraneum]